MGDSEEIQDLTPLESSSAHGAEAEGDRNYHVNSVYTQSVLNPKNGLLEDVPIPQGMETPTEEGIPTLVDAIEAVYTYVPGSKCPEQPVKNPRTTGTLRRNLSPVCTPCSLRLDYVFTSSEHQSEQ